MTEEIHSASPNPLAGGDNADLARLAGTPPDTLFHYTSAQGLKGIIESGNIWATDLAFLNDRRELQYGLGLMRRSIMRMDDGAWTEEMADFVLGLRETPPAARLMVACFTEHGDQLGQWRGYGQQDGYSIGFDTTKLCPVLNEGETQHPFFGVSYDVALSQRLADVWARLLMDAWKNLQKSDAWPRDVNNADADDVETLAKALYEFSGTHVMRAAMACSYVKDPSFVEEQEWRVVVPVVPRSTGHSIPVKFREGSLGLTPYVEVALCGDDGRVPISKIILGPGDNADLRATAVRALLREHGYGNDAQVEVSNVPFRP